MVGFWVGKVGAVDGPLLGKVVGTVLGDDEGESVGTSVGTFEGVWLTHNSCVNCLVLFLRTMNLRVQF